MTTPFFVQHPKSGTDDGSDEITPVAIPHWPDFDTDWSRQSLKVLARLRVTHSGEYRRILCHDQCGLSAVINGSVPFRWRPGYAFSVKVPPPSPNHWRRKTRNTFPFNTGFRNSSRCGEYEWLLQGDFSNLGQGARCQEHILASVSTALSHLML
jgi:hypothetical protein